MNALGIWLLSVLHVMSPEARDAKLARGNETAEQRADRYVGIATDIAAVTTGHALPGLTEEKTAVLLASAAFYESSFAPDVDNGTCNEKLTYDLKKRCDGGSSVGLLQIHFGKGQKSFMGHTMDDLRGISNRRTMLATALSAMRMGVTACARELRHDGKPTSAQILTAGLSWYAVGSCHSTKGLADGEKKLKLMERVLHDKRYPKFDPNAVDLVAVKPL